MASSPRQALPTLVDSNVLLDLVTDDSDWSSWSASALATVVEAGPLVINQLIFAEVSVRFSTIEEVEEAFPDGYFARKPLPWSAGFLAGKCFENYRKQGGTKRSPLPDFFIGAQGCREQTAVAHARRTSISDLLSDRGSPCSRVTQLPAGEPCIDTLAGKSGANHWPRE